MWGMVLSFAGGLLKSRKLRVALAVVAVLLVTHGAVYLVGKAHGDVNCAETKTKQQEVRADVAERQRDIANAPRKRGRALLDGLSRAAPGGQ